MLRSIHIENFRCIQSLDVPILERVNLFAGRNSVGKTALLEALFLLIGAENLELIMKISQFRGIRDLRGDVGSVLDLLWAPLFYGLETSRKIVISSDLGGRKQQKVELFVEAAESQTLKIGGDEESSASAWVGLGPRHLLRQVYSVTGGDKKDFTMKLEGDRLAVEPVPGTPPFPGHFLYARSLPVREESADIVGKLVRYKRADQLDLVEVLKVVEPRLIGLEIIPVGGTTMIYGDVGLSQMIPISLMGDGMSRILEILLRVANASGGVVLIDEIENGLHYSILEDFWKMIDRAARTFDTQIIATTHSYDCISSAHEAFSKNEDYGFFLHRLDRVDNQVEVVTYDRQALDAALEFRFEVR